jgi:CheY-like chemotaxis protein
MDADFTGLDGVHVLVVEDDDDSREALRQILKHCGALVTTAGTTDEAHHLLALLRPHVLVTDTGMPQDRLGLVRAVQALSQAHGVQIPTIAMTEDRTEQAEFWAAGVAEVLVKPLDAMALCRVVRRLVTQN